MRGSLLLQVQDFHLVVLLRKSFIHSSLITLPFSDCTKKLGNCSGVSIPATNCSYFHNNSEKLNNASILTLWPWIQVREITAGIYTAYWHWQRKLALLAVQVHLSLPVSECQTGGLVEGYQISNPDFVCEQYAESSVLGLLGQAVRDP